jgi:hypothetical protein
LSTVIIGGGSKLRALITDLENASVTMNQTDRDDSESFLDSVSSCIKARLDDNVAFPIIP